MQQAGLTVCIQHDVVMGKCPLSIVGTGLGNCQQFSGSQWRTRLC